MEFKNDYEMYSLFTMLKEDTWLYESIKKAAINTEVHFYSDIEQNTAVFSLTEPEDTERLLEKFTLYEMFKRIDQGHEGKYAYVEFLLNSQMPIIINFANK